MDKKEIELFMQEEFEPLYDLFEDGKIKKTLQDSNDQLNYLYETLGLVETIKTKVDFITNYFIFIEKKVDEDIWEFEAAVADLSDMILAVKSDIELLEGKAGKKYFKEVQQFAGLAKNYKDKSIEEQERKMILQLIMVTAAGNLFADNATAIGHAISNLTGFSSKKITDDIGEKRKKEQKKQPAYKRKNYIDAISKLKDIIDTLEKKCPPGEM